MYKKCFVPGCSNNFRNNQEKVFVPVNKHLKRLWCRQVKVDYDPKHRYYCCDDHLNLEEALENYHYWRMMKGRPMLKKSARLLVESVSSEVSDKLVIENPELANLLLQPEPIVPAKKQKHGDVDASSTSHAISLQSFQVEIAVQASVITAEKATNTDPRSIKVNIQSITEQSASTTVSESPSLNCNSQSQAIHKEFKIRKMNLNKVFKRPEMYLGLPKQYIWLIDLIVEKSLSEFDPLCIILTLLKIKQNDTVQRLSDEFEISCTNVLTMILKGIKTLASFFQNLIFSPSPKAIKLNRPLNTRHSNVQMILDSFEVEIGEPPDLLKKIWWKYNSCKTVKYLIGCTPTGLISFISKGYSSRISDEAIVEKSSLLDVVRPNAVAADEGGVIEIEGLLKSLGFELLRSHCEYSGAMSTGPETKQSKLIASLREPIERVNKCISEFLILKPHSVVNYKYVPYLDEIVTIACGLINLQVGIIIND